MANTYLNSSLISKEAVAIFETENSVISTAYKGDYENMFSDAKYKTGDTINLREDNFYTSSRGDSITAQDILEESIQMTILPLFSVAIRYTPTDLQRNIADFSAEFIRPAVRSLVADMNKAILDGACTQVSKFTGDSTSYINTFESFDDANRVLDESNANGYDRYFALSPKNAHKLRGALYNSFNDTLNEKIIWRASLGNLADFDVMKDNAISTFNAGNHASGGNIAVLNATSDGSTLTLAGFAPGGTVNVGDHFSLSGVKEWDRINKKALDNDMQFTVTAVSNNGIAPGNGQLTVTIFPALKSTTARQNYITPGTNPNTVPANTVVNFVGNYVNNVFYTSRGLAVVIPALERMDSPDSQVYTDPTYGVSIRVSKTAEVLDNKNVLRMDAQMAFKWIPGQCGLFLSK